MKTSLPLKTTTVPKGGLLYHGTQQPGSFVFPDGPAWFSDSRSVAETFVTWHGVGAKQRGRPRILVYKVVKPLSRLWLVRSSLEFKRWIDKVSPYDDLEDGPEIAAACCGAGYNGWHMPTNYPDGSDTLICDPERFLELVRVERVSR